MKPDFAIVEEKKHGDITHLTINTSHASYQGVFWRNMGDFGKRKFENFLVLSRTNEKLRFCYV